MPEPRSSHQAAGLGAADMGALTVLGHANIDVQLQLQDLPKAHQSHPVLSRRTVYGGTAANVAAHAASLGVPTTLWARVGTDFPADWRERLEAAGLRLALDVDPERGTPTCFILHDAAGDQAYCMDQGAMGAMREHPPGVSLLDGMDGGSWLHFCTGAPEAYIDLAVEAGRRGIPVALDPGQEIRFAYDDRSLQRMLDAAAVLFVNEFELEVACRLMRYGDPVQFLDHVDTVVVTRGVRGATLYDGGKPVHVDAVPVAEVVDPTGAGDALRAGWYAGLHAGLGMEDALRWGVAAGAVAVRYAGPQERLVSRADLDALLA